MPDFPIEPGGVRHEKYQRLVKAAQGLSTTAGGLLENLEKIRIVRCDEAAWRFLGLSFAGWNVLISLALAVGAVTAAVEGLRRSA